MLTVIFYCSILLFSTFFIYLRERGKGKLEYYFFTSLAFLLIFIPSAIRYDVGTDYLSYQNIYFNLEYYKDLEPGFYYICYFLKLLHANDQWMFAVFAFIFTVASFCAYPKKYSWIFHFAFVCLLWYLSFNIMRQTAALAFCLLAISSYFKARYIYFFVLTLFASLFHSSSLFILFAGIVALIPINEFSKIRMVPNIFIFGIFFTFISSTLVMSYIEQILNILGMVKYASYFNNSQHFIELDFGSGLGILTKCLFACYTIYRAEILLRVNQKYWILIILCFLYGVGVTLANNIIIFGRMADTFSVALIFSVYLLYKHDLKNIITKAVVGIFIVFLMLTFIKMGFGEITSYTDPKRNPYVTI